MRDPQLAQAESPRFSWLLKSPQVILSPLPLPSGEQAQILRDDLLDPYCGGNKLRKLDGWLPKLLQDSAPDDLITVGGIQSAHCTALAALVARYAPSKRVHLLLRGELPKVPTGNLLMSQLFAHRVACIDRDLYADRQRALEHYVQREGLSSYSFIPEGAHHPEAMLGLKRLVKALAAELSTTKPYRLVVDSGTGTTAIGLGMAIWELGLPWHIDAIMLTGSEDEFRTKSLALTARSDLPISWHPRVFPRRFGKILPDDVAACQHAARQTGVVFDPIYTLASWRHLCERAIDPEHAVLIHTGGTLNMFGVAQRVPGQFHALCEG